MASILRQDDGKITHRGWCAFCGEPSEVKDLDLDSYNNWLSGQFVQDAFPDLSAGDREILISGTHDECFKKAFSEEEEEGDEEEGMDDE